MKTDRELLELAAKAAGNLNPRAEWKWYSSPIPGFYWCPNVEPSCNIWNPLLDDGDCARLEVSCELQVDIGDIGVISERLDGTACFEKYADHDGDKNKARRRASVRAAAAIGESMP